jgi:hypothetical protein
MNNKQLASLFSASVASLSTNEPLPLDYRDRAIELAIYFNETIADVKNSEAAIEEVRWAMMIAYSHRFNLDLSAYKEEMEMEKEGGDRGNSGADSVQQEELRDSERLTPS